MKKFKNQRKKLKIKRKEKKEEVLQKHLLLLNLLVFFPKQIWILHIINSFKSKFSTAEKVADYLCKTYSNYSWKMNPPLLHLVRDTLASSSNNNDETLSKETQNSWIWTWIPRWIRISRWIWIKKWIWIWRRYRRSIGIR